MRKIFRPFLIVLLCTNCANRPTQEQYNELVFHNQSLQQTIEQLRDSIKILSFPADQRFNQIKELINKGDFSSARIQIQSLHSIFPNSDEAKCSVQLLTDIQQKEEKQKKEQERIKALGFKAIAPKTSFAIDYNTVMLSNIVIGQNYIIDRYDDEYHYYTADRGYKYITATMTIKSTNSYPRLPQPAIYKIIGNQMVFVSRFAVHFYKWKNYGAYLGNHSDFNNDFSKVSEIRFSIGTQVSNTISSGAYAIVCKNSNDLERKYEQFENPPISYVGNVNYPNSLALESFKKGDYTLVKLYNLK